MTAHLRLRTSVRLNKISSLIRIWLTPRKKRQPVDPQSLIINPQVDLMAIRQTLTSIKLHWTIPAESVMVRVDYTPDHIPTTSPILVKQADYVLITDVDPQRRPYFHLTFTHSGQTFTRWVAERMLPLHTRLNIRDIGGYPTQQGQHVRWGKVYRSGALYALSVKDVQYLEGLDWRWICDLRTASEVKDAPTQLTTKPTRKFESHSFFTDKESSDSALRFLTRLNKIEEAVIDSYTAQLLDVKGTTFGRIFSQLAQRDNLPAVIHCTAGKDRTGVSIAILLDLLGVPADVIIADYTLTNSFHELFWKSVEDNMFRLRLLRIKMHELQPLLLARAETMQATLHHLQRRYGGAEGYLRQQAQLDPATLQRIRDNLLE